MFVHTPSIISSFGLDGNLLATAETESLISVNGDLAYSNGWLITATELFDANDLSLVARFSEFGGAISIFENQAVFGVPFQDNDQAFSFTVPEPEFSWLSALAIIFSLSRLRVRRFHFEVSSITSATNQGNSRPSICW